jgi:hypothetical protein
MAVFKIPSTDIGTALIGEDFSLCTVTQAG